MFRPEPVSGEIVRPQCGDPADWESARAEIEVDRRQRGRYAMSVEQLEEALDAYDEDEGR